MRAIMKVTVFLAVLIICLQNSFAFDHQHQKLSQILSTHLKIKDRQSLLNYKNLAANPEILDSYLTDLSAVSKKLYKTFTPDQKLCFLINAYNGFTLKLIIKNYPVKSIKDIGTFFTKPWSIEFFKLFGEKFTLDKIEHQTIRKNFKEAKIHFAVNCASISCPSLYKEAFVENKLQQQLTEASVNFLKNSRKNQINILGQASNQAKTIKLSKIFSWYGEDFDKYETSVKYFIAKSLNYSEQQRSIMLSNDIDLDYLEYDWSLNEWID
jgi:hypothetical protein